MSATERRASEPDDARVEELRLQVWEQEQRLRYAVRELESAARRVVDPQRHYEQRPWLFAGAAFALGAWVGWRKG